MENRFEKTPHAQRPEVKVVGSGPMERKEAKKKFIERQFSEGNLRENFNEDALAKLEKHEFLKGEREMDYIRKINEVTNRIMRECGATAFDIPEQNVVFIDDELYRQVVANSDTSGTYNRKFLAALIKGSPNESSVFKVGVAFHEMIHAKEFVSFEVGETNSAFRRGGLTTESPLSVPEDKIKIKGTGLNEAVVATIERDHIHEIINDNAYFQKNITPITKFKTATSMLEQKIGLGRDGKVFYSEKGQGHQINFGYEQQRKVLDHVVREVVKGKPEMVRGDVLKLFYKAHFSGELLPIARLVEGTFGKGSFDRLMQMTTEDKSAKEVLEFLKSRQKSSLSKQKKETMEKKILVSQSPLEVLIPNKKKARQDAIHPAFTEEESIRNEAWHGEKKVEEQREEAPKRRATVHSLEEARMRKGGKEVEELDGVINTNIRVLLRGSEQIGEQGTTPWPADQVKSGVESIARFLERKKKVLEQIGDAGLPAAKRVAIDIEEILKTLPQSGEVDPDVLVRIKEIIEGKTAIKEEKEASVAQETGVFATRSAEDIQKEIAALSADPSVNLMEKNKRLIALDIELEKIKLRELQGGEAEAKKMSPAETREAREREEVAIDKIAQGIFEARMQGVNAEGVNKILAEKDIKPWTPEAEEFMKKWDWEQAEQIFKKISQEQEQAVELVNGVEPRGRIELSESQEDAIRSKFEQFGVKPTDMEQIGGFDTLTYGQRLLVIENLHQATLGRVQEEAVDRHQKDVANAKWYGKIWRNVFAKPRIDKYERETAQKITHGGLAHHREVLEKLTAGAEHMGLDVAVEKDGSLMIQYLAANELLNPAEQKQVATFNVIGQKFSKLPSEWAFAREGSKERKEYDRALGEFEQVKRAILKTEGNRLGDKNAMHAVANAEFKLRSNQFFNTHPNALNELASIESDALWKRGLGSGDALKERGTQMSIGAIGRVAGASLLGKAAALPIVGALVGGFMARKRAEETLATQARQTRGGKEADARFKDMMYATVPATHLSDRLERIINAVRASENDPEQYKKHLAALQTRLEYTTSKMHAGRIDQGASDVRVGNRYNLFDKMGTGWALLEEAKIVDALESEEKKGERSKRLDIIFGKEHDEVEAMRDIYKGKEARKGMVIGATFSLVGYFVAQEVMGAYGPGPSGAPAEASTKGMGVAQGTQEAMPGGGKGAGFAAAAEQAKEATAAARQERGPIILDIGKRGPEGAFIDELKKHPEMAQRLGIKDIGKEAHAAWAEFAKEELKDPETQKVLGDLGYPKTEAGYADMMRRIEHGKITLEESGGKLHMRIDEDTEYFRARPKVSMTKGAPLPEGIPNEPQIFEETLPLNKQPIDVDKAIREQPIEGITSPVPHVEKPTIALENLVEDRFGLDADEYHFVSTATVEKILKEIPSRDEAWAIWRGEVPGSEITLPHDGIYGALEFKKHIDLAEYIRSKQPNPEAMHRTVGDFVRETYKEEGFNLSEAGKPGTAETPSTYPHSGEKVMESAVPSDAERAAPPVAELQPTPAPMPIATDVEDIPTGQQIMEGATPGRESIIAPEKLSLLNDDIYNSKMPVQKIIAQYKVGNITAEDFANYYSEKVVHVKPSPETVKNVTQTFKWAAGEGTEQQRIMAQNGIKVLVQRMQGMK